MESRRGQRIVLVTPARDEEKHIVTTIACMSLQTLLPVKWVIVNDGSSDNTEQLVKASASDLPFVQYVAVPDRGFRRPGQGVIEAFYEGMKKLEGIEYDVIAKFDGDLEFPPDTLEQISEAFARDPRLGITGGTLYERANEREDYKKVLGPQGFVQGPVKFYRAQCFRDIGGLATRSGWDGIDIIKAQMRGWETGEIESLSIVHLRPMGTAQGEGMARACEKYGDVSYYMGGYAWYFLLRLIGRSVQWRSPKAAYHMLRGYLRPRLAGEVRESKEFRAFLKRVQRKNMLFWLLLALRAFGTPGNGRKNGSPPKNLTSGEGQGWNASFSS